jgi:hypothetical protein
MLSRMAPPALSRLLRVAGASALLGLAGLVPNACSLNPQPLPPDTPVDAGNFAAVGDSGGKGGGPGDATTTPSPDSGSGFTSGDSAGTTSPDAAADAGAPGDGGGGAPDGGEGGVPGDGGDSGEITDGGDAALGAPCTTDNQCSGALCLGGAFTGGYCSSSVPECDPGGAACGDAGLCTKAGGVDVDGAAQAEFCLMTCQGSSDCRQGYSCCYGATYAQQAGLMVCVPPSLCPDQ